MKTTAQVLTQSATTASPAPAPPADASGQSSDPGAIGKSHQSWLNFSQVSATIISFPESFYVQISIASRLFMQVSGVLQGRLFSEEISTENLGDVLLFGLYGLMLIQIVLRR